MPEFPKTEAEIEELAQIILSALRDKFDGLNGAPVTADELALFLGEFQTKNNESRLAHAAAKELTGEKRDKLNRLKQAMRQILRFAESKRLSKARMERIGWGARHARRPAVKPAQPMDLNIVKEGTDWLSLHWKIDRSGGKARFYRIMRRGENGEFYEIASSLGTEHNVIELPRGVQLTLYVVAVNRAGESLPSNFVSAVL